MKYIDIHSHLNLSQFDTDRDEVIQRLKENDIGTITVGVDYATSLLAVEYAEKNEHLFACVGQHPNDNKEEVFNYEQMLSLSEHKKVVAIGECGLDYFRGADEEEKKRQKEVFLQHIRLAQETHKPLMIHTRPSKGSMDAYTEVLDILEIYKKETPELHANFHFFVGDMSIAKRILDLGFSVSYDGPITFASDYDEVIRMIPIQSIMCETDAPFASPVPYRGKRCEPYMVVEVVKKIAEIKGLALDFTIKQIRENVKRIFDI